MKKFIPINKHLVIEPIAQEGFMASASEVYEEKGTVIDIALPSESPIKVGDVVYFDSYVVAKFHDAAGKLRYLVQEEYVRAIERDEEVPTE